MLFLNYFAFLHSRFLNDLASSFYLFIYLSFADTKFHASLTSSVYLLLLFLCFFVPSFKTQQRRVKLDIVPTNFLLFYCCFFFYIFQLLYYIILLLLCCFSHSFSSFSFPAAKTCIISFSHLFLLLNLLSFLLISPYFPSSSFS